MPVIADFSPGILYLNYINDSFSKIKFIKAIWYVIAK